MTAMDAQRAIQQLQAQVAALQQLLEVQEQTVFTQSDRIETVIRELRLRAEQLAQANAQLTAEIAKRQETEKALKKEKDTLELMNSIMMGREERVTELKDEVNALLKELSRTPKYGR